MARALSVSEFEAKKFNELSLSADLEEFIGRPEQNFSMIWYGKSGNGKTEGAIIVVKKILLRYKNFRALYNSYEQGFSKSLQDAFRRQNMAEVNGQVLLTHKEPLKAMIDRLKRKKSPQIVVLDSIQYVKLTYEQWQELRNTFPRKIFILISHANGDEPDGYHARKIEFDVDIKVLVKGYQAHPKSRFGGNQVFTIWEDGHRKWLSRQRVRAAPVAPAPTGQLTLIPEEKKEAI